MLLVEALNEQKAKVSERFDREIRAIEEQMKRKKQARDDEMKSF